MASASGLWKVVKRLGRAPVVGAAALGSVAHFGREHPWMSAGIALGGFSLMTYNTGIQQAIPAGPAEQQARPGSLDQRSNFDLGATGDLVFALHRLGQM